MTDPKTQQKTPDDKAKAKPDDKASEQQQDELSIEDLAKVSGGRKRTKTFGRS